MRTVPYLVRGSQDISIGASKERIYYVTISNESGWLGLGGFGLHPWLSSTANWLGYRYLSFDAGVRLLDGKVSRVQYGIANELIFPRVIGYIVSARSYHGLWAPHQTGFEVTSANDESPQYRINGGDEHLSVAYMYDAPHDLTSRAFQVELSCFWSLVGCRHARQVAPLLWHDKQAIEAAALARLKSNDPCPDRILTGRVRYLLDVDLLLLEVISERTERVNEEGHDVDEYYTDYRVVEVLRGNSRRTWNSVRTRTWLPSDANPVDRIYNPVRNGNAPGSRVLMFANHDFYSCTVVPATLTALTAVRNTVPAPRRREDEAVSGPM